MKIEKPLRLLRHALRLSRANNLIIVFFTQYFAAIFLMSGEHSVIDIIASVRFFAMALSTVIIAASGYFINDYYDIKIDLINKPHKVIVGKQIARRKVMLAHFALNTIGIMLGAWVSWWIGLVNLAAAFLLWLYSNLLKRMPFVGNLVVAVLTGSTLLVLNIFFKTNDLLLFTYAFFAFGINLIREIIKDIEDMEGDIAFDSNSLPVLLGSRNTKLVLYVLILAYLVALALFLHKLGNSILSAYFSILSIPFLHFVYLIQLADTKKKFSFLSKYCKWIILAGILSMALLNF